MSKLVDFERRFPTKADEYWYWHPRLDPNRVRRVRVHRDPATPGGLRYRCNRRFAPGSVGESYWRPFHAHEHPADLLISVKIQRLREREATTQEN